MQELGLVTMMREMQEADVATFNEVGGEFDEAFREAITVIAMQEGMDPAEVQLALEDRGWLRLSGGDERAMGGLPAITRRSTIIRARVYSQLDSHAVASLRTWNNYTVGTGVSVKATDATLNGNIQKFLKSPKNRTMTSSAGQHKHNRKLLVDGELFFAIFDDDPAPTIRKVDCTEVTEFITDPEDAEVVWAYRRERVLPNGEKDVRYYRNWAYPNQSLAGVLVQSETGATKVEPEDGVLMYHLAFEPQGQRGCSLFCSSLPWLTAMRGFMQDRIAITKGLAKYISKLTVKGGTAQMQKISKAFDQLQRTPAPAPNLTGARPGINPALQAATSSAKTFLENSNVELSNMPRTTGASDGRQDYKSIRLMIAAGMGMTEPYFGDAESGNLATATAMELPMLKQFQTHQKLWQDAWADIFTIVAYYMTGGEETENEMMPVDVDVDFPPIVEADVTKTIAAIVDACAEFPELVQPEVLKMVLVTLGLPNVDDVMERVLAKQEEMKTNIAKGLNADGSQPQPIVQPPKPVQQAGAPTGQKTNAPPAAPTMKEALALFHKVLEAETAEMNDLAEAE